MKNIERDVVKNMEDVKVPFGGAIKGLGAFAGMVLLAVNSLVMESYAQVYPMDAPYENSSLKTHISNTTQAYGDNAGSYALAISTYPGMKIGSAIHNTAPFKE